ncbi:MAG: LPS export ABC transporter periplasmic protein LptC [Flavobacteriaceae bacterium]
MSDFAIARHGQDRGAPRRFAGALDDARRHTRRVMLLRRALPAAALVISILILLSGLDLTGGLPSVDIGEVKMDGSTVTMTNPELSGYGKNNEAYRVTATRAEQDIKSPNLVRLHTVDGTLNERGGRETTLSAASGLYNAQKRTLVLEKDVVVSSSNGYVAHLERADVDMGAGRVTSDKPVMIEGLDGTIRSDAVEIEDKGARILFTGRVVVDVLLDSEAARDAGNGKDTKAAEKKTP